MAINVAIVQDEIISTDTNVDFTETGFGTVQACIILARPEAEANSPENRACMSITFSDGTRTRSISIDDKDGVTTTQSRKASANNFCITQRFGRKVDCDVSFITNGVRLTNVTNTSAVTTVTVVLINGVENAYVNDFDPTDIDEDTTSVTDPGFQPNIGFFITTGNTFVDGIPEENDSLFSLGMVTDFGSISQGGLAWLSLDGESTSSIRSRIYDNRFIYKIPYTDGQYSFDSFDTNGFTVKTKIVGSGNIGYLVMELSEGDEAELTFNQHPSSSGSATYEFTNIKDPKLIFNAMSFNPALNTTSTNSNANALSFSVIDSAENNRSLGIASEDGVTTTDCGQYSDDKAFLAYSDETNKQIEADLTSVDATSYTVNYTTLNTTESYFISLAIGSGLVSDSFYDHVFGRGYNRGFGRGY